MNAWEIVLHNAAFIQPTIIELSNNRMIIYTPSSLFLNKNKTFTDLIATDAIKQWYFSQKRRKLNKEKRLWINC